MGGPITIQIVEKPNQPYCTEEPHQGYCKSNLDQWYYNATEGKCATFKYTGCGGNKNNFKTESECLEVCHPNMPDKRFNTMFCNEFVETGEYFEQQEVQFGGREDNQTV